MGNSLGSKFVSIGWFLVVCGLAQTLESQTIESLPYRALLSPRNQVPPVSLQANGVATVWLRVVRDGRGVPVSASAEVNLRYQFPGSTTVNGLRFQRGAPGTVGEPLFTSSFSGLADSTGRAGLSRRLSVPLEAARSILANPGLVQLSVETTAFPNGALRGPLALADEAVLLARLQPDHSADVALAGLHVLATRDPRGRLTSAELSLQISKPIGPVDAEFALDGKPSLKFENLPSIGDASVPVFELPIDQAHADLITALLRTPGRVTLGVTDRQSASQMKGDLHGTDRALFQSQLLPSPTTLLLRVHTLRDASGQAIAARVLLDLPADSGATQAVLTGKGGQPIFDRTLVPGRILPSALLIDRESLAGLNDLLLKPEDGTIKLAGTVAESVPGLGAGVLGVRGRPPIAQSVISAVWAPEHRTLAPGGLFTVFGRDLTQVSGDLAGLIGNRIPTTINGTSVLMAGRAVPVLDIRADRIIAQVPTDMPIGTHSVVVRNSHGDSGAIQAPVAAVAPAVFFSAHTAEGPLAVVHKANGTAVSMENPARPNDLLLFFSTGFGARTLPAFGSGSAAPESPLVRTPNPSVTIGGRLAAVVYSVLVPGLVGIVQTAVRMPQNAGSGNLPLVVQVGETRANAVIFFAALR